MILTLTYVETYVTVFGPFVLREICVHRISVYVPTPLPQVSVESIMEFNSETRSPKLNVHTVDLTNVSLRRPLRPINHGNDSCYSGKTFITNFGNSHLRAYTEAAADHNKRAGREEIVISGHATDSYGRLMKGNSSVHLLTHPDDSPSLDYFWDRRKYYLTKYNLGEFSHAVVTETPFVPPTPKKSSFGESGTGNFITNFDASTQKKRAIYNDVVIRYKKQTGKNIWICPTAYCMGGGLIPNYMSIWHEKVGQFDPVFWRILDEVKEEQLLQTI